MRRSYLVVSAMAVAGTACIARLPAPGAVPIASRIRVRTPAHVNVQANVDVRLQGAATVTAPQVSPPPPPAIVAIENAPVVEFFGISLEGAQDVLFVLDISGSMLDPAPGRVATYQIAAAATAPPPPAGPPPPNGPPPDGAAPPDDEVTATPTQPGGAPPPTTEPSATAPTPMVVTPTKIAVAKAELVEALRRLPAGTRMNIVFFNRYVDALAPAPFTLDEASRASTMSFVEDTAAAGSTALAPAMRLAFVMNARHVVLLSDGLGNVGGGSDAVLRDAREAMRGGVRIDTIGLGHGHDESLLSTLARESGGLYQPL